MTTNESYHPSREYLDLEIAVAQKIKAVELKFEPNPDDVAVVEWFLEYGKELREIIDKKILENPTILEDLSNPSTKAKLVESIIKELNERFTITENS